MSPQEIEALLEKAIAGDKEAFSDLYQYYRENIRRFVLSRTGSVDLADDLTSETFLRALRYIGAYQIRGVPVESWLFRIAHNLIASHYRQKKRETSLELAGGELGNKDNAFRRIEHLLDLQKRLRELPKLQRQVTILRSIHGLDLKQTAKTLKRSVASVKTAQHRARLKLRERFKKEETPD